MNCIDRFRSFWRRQRHAVALIGVFLGIAVFIVLFVELVRADQLALATAREIAELEAAWNRLQLDALRSPDYDSARLDEFKHWTDAHLDQSRLASLAATAPPLDSVLRGLRDDVAALTPAAVAAAARRPEGTDAIDRRLAGIRSWMASFTRGQSRAFRILLFLYGAVLIGSVGVAMAFARDLRSSEQQGLENRLLAQRFIRIQEDERSRLAAELHDDAAQSVASAALIASRVAEELGPHPHLERLQSALDGSLTTIRNLSRDLGVNGLEGVPLPQAIDQLIAERTEGLGTETCYEGLEDSLLSPEQKLHIYRIVQECMTNTLRHAEASHIRLRIVVSYPNLMLRFSDDGRGFQAARNDDDRPHLGLRSIHERARMLGGELAVRSRPGAGTEITLVMPIE
jgi:signal transduction histidine kinase